MGVTVKKWLESHAKTTVVSNSVRSWYFDIKGCIVRYSDHVAETSKCNLSIVKTDDGYVLIGFPNKIAKTLTKPCDVKLFVESYIFCCTCNTIATIKKTSKTEKKLKAAKKANAKAVQSKTDRDRVLNEHKEKARIIIHDVEKYEPVECDDEIRLSDCTSTCFSNKWNNRIATFYDVHPQWRYALYYTAFSMRTLCDEIRGGIWERLCQRVEECKAEEDNKSVE